MNEEVFFFSVRGSHGISGRYEAHAVLSDERGRHVLLARSSKSDANAEIGSLHNPLIAFKVLSGKNTAMGHNLEILSFDSLHGATEVELLEIAREVHVFEEFPIANHYWTRLSLQEVSSLAGRVSTAR